MRRSRSRVIVCRCSTRACSSAWIITSWDINGREGQKIPWFSVWLPLPLRLANANATVEIVHDTAQMLDQASLLVANSRNDAVKADVMFWALRQWRERPLVRTDLLAQAHDLVDTRR